MSTLVEGPIRTHFMRVVSFSAAHHVAQCTATNMCKQATRDVSFRSAKRTAVADHMVRCSLFVLSWHGAKKVHLSTHVNNGIKFRRCPAAHLVIQLTMYSWSS